ncbi:MAG: TraR/DksA C4-type zinc finger protein [Porphyromonadaceae bacterium]|nr:TraR/DksA C4-type zinc finger protein [Porphyromonadaceae bacterium]
MSTEKTFYTEEELQEFREIINKKLAKAISDFELLREGAISSGNDISDTTPTFKSLQESAANLARGENGYMAERLYKFIQGLQAALVRIENGTYGICRKTGKLIPKERLRAVPHATLSIEAKLGE